MLELAYDANQFSEKKEEPTDSYESLNKSSNSLGEESPFSSTDSVNYTTSRDLIHENKTLHEKLYILQDAVKEIAGAAKERFGEEFSTNVADVEAFQKGVVRLKHR